MHEGRPTSVVLATNGSTRCRRAIVRAAVLFPDARLVVTVVVPDGLGRPPLAETDVAELVPAVQGAAQLHLQATAETLGDVCHALGPRARAVVLDGDPARGVVRLATAERADVIVVGSLRRARRSVLLPTVADELVAGAPCPVIDLGR